MALSASTVLGSTHCGSRKVAWGTFTYTGSDVTGDITTRLQVVEGFTLTCNSANVTGVGCSVDETFPVNNVGGVVTVCIPASTSGYWTAIGR